MGIFFFSPATVWRGPGQWRPPGGSPPTHLPQFGEGRVGSGHQVGLLFLTCHSLVRTGSVAAARWVSSSSPATVSEDRVGGGPQVGLLRLTYQSLVRTGSFFSPATVWRGQGRRPQVGLLLLTCQSLVRTGSVAAARWVSFFSPATVWRGHGQWRRPGGSSSSHLPQFGEDRVGGGCQVGLLLLTWHSLVQGRWRPPGGSPPPHLPQFGEDRVSDGRQVGLLLLTWHSLVRTGSVAATSWVSSSSPATVWRGQGWWRPPDGSPPPYLPQFCEDRDGGGSEVGLLLLTCHS